MSEEGPNETTEEFENRCEVDAITVAFLLVKAAQFALELRGWANAKRHER